MHNETKLFLAAALTSFAAASTSGVVEANTPTLETIVVRASPIAGGWDLAIGYPNSGSEFLTGNWETDTSGMAQNTYTAALSPECDLLQAMGLPEGCNPHVVKLQSGAESVAFRPGTNAAICAATGSYCTPFNLGQPSHFMVWANLAVVNNLMNCYGSVFSNPLDCEQGFAESIDGSCDYMELMSFTREEVAQCRTSYVDIVSAIGGARLERLQDGADYFGASIEGSFGINFGPFGINIVREQTLDSAESMNRALVEARKFAQCKSWTNRAIAQGCMAA